MAEANTRVSLHDHMDVKFKAQEKFNAAQFKALRQEINASRTAFEEKLDAHARSEVERQDLHARLDAQRWRSHEKTHQRERNIGTALLAVIGTIATAIGARLPK